MDWNIGRLSGEHLAEKVDKFSAGVAVGCFAQHLAAGGVQGRIERTGAKRAWICTCSTRSLKMRTQRLSHRTHTCRPIYSGGAS
jgi:hypothetical protein